MDILIRIIVFSLARKQLLGTHHFRCEGVIKSRIALVCVRQLQAFLKAKQEHVRFCEIDRLRRRKYVLTLENHAPSYVLSAVSALSV